MELLCERCVWLADGGPSSVSVKPMYSSDFASRYERIAIVVGVALVVIAGTVGAALLGFSGHGAH
jgi:hypothetical protein